MLSTEEWKPLIGYEEAYEISDHGRLRRSVNRFGNPSGRFCKPSYGRGYARYTLSFDNRVRIFSAHRLVWETFVGPIPPALQINHKNGVKDDNRLENLELMTSGENTRHAYEVLGLAYRPAPWVPGERNGRALVTENDVREIRTLHANGMTQIDIAKMFAIKVGAVGCIIRRNTWRHVA